MNKLNVCLKLLAKIMILVFITIVLIEISFRCYNAIHPSFVFSNNSYSRFRPKPFSMDYDFRLNSGGFNDVEHSIVKKKDIFRIVGIGDSCTFGVVPHEDNFLTLLNRKLNQKGEHFEVINMGIPYLGVDGYFALLIREGIRFKPDLVICCFFIGNDFAYPSDMPSKLYIKLFLRYVFDIYPHYSGLTIHGPGGYDDLSKTFEYKRYLEIEKERSLVFVKDSKEFSRQLDWALSYLLRINKVCAQNNSRLLIVIIPDEMQVNIPLQKDIVSMPGSFPAQDYDFDIPNKMLSAKLDELNIMYLDLLEDFKVSTKEKRHYRSNDTHWNIAGHALAAEIIYQKLRTVAPARNYLNE